MRLAALDRRVRKEARGLLAEAKRGLGRVKLPTGVGDELRTRVGAVETALAAGDLARVRRGLPALDALVDEHLTPTRKSTGREYGESITIAIVIALLLRSFVIEAFKIPSASMIPTMQIGDHIFVNKFIYGIRIPFTKIKLLELRRPRPGEVIVFMNPCTPDKDFIKRVVAVEGDTVEVRCNLLYVNGKAVVPDLVDDGVCHYWDLEESSGQWHEQTECSRYRERLGDQVFEALHDQDRPGRDARIAASKGREVYEEGGDGFQHDFPRLGAGDTLDDVDPFVCPSGDQRTPQERARSLGSYGWSTPDGSPPAETCAPRVHYVVPSGHVFAMGDNRSNSSDSRTWGPVPVDHIKGKALFIWWSHGAKEGVRLERMGGIVQ
jgi:signal peptidase I